MRTSSAAGSRIRFSVVFVKDIALYIVENGKDPSDSKDLTCLDPLDGYVPRNRMFRKELPAPAPWSGLKWAYRHYNGHCQPHRRAVGKRKSLLVSVKLLKPLPGSPQPDSFVCREVVSLRKAGSVVNN